MGTGGNTELTRTVKNRLQCDRGRTRVLSDLASQSSSRLVSVRDNEVPSNVVGQISASEWGNCEPSSKFEEVDNLQGEHQH